MCGSTPAVSNVGSGVKKTALSEAMDPLAAAPQIDQALIESYEELRSQVLAGCGNRMGLTAFLRHGMRSWMGIWRSSKANAEVAQRGESHPPHTVTVGLRSEIAMLLTSMALNAQTEVSR